MNLYISLNIVLSNILDKCRKNRFRPIINRVSELFLQIGILLAIL